MTIDEHLAAIEARLDTAGTLELSESNARLTRALRWAVNRLQTMGMEETLAAIEKILQGKNIS